MASANSEPAQAGDVPDWLSGSDVSQASDESAPTGDVPDWLSGLDNLEVLLNL